VGDPRIDGSPDGRRHRLNHRGEGHAGLTKRSVTGSRSPWSSNFAGNNGVGKMWMGGQDRPIDADLRRSLFADGGGALYQVLGSACGAREGYSRRSSTST